VAWSLLGVEPAELFEVAEKALQDLLASLWRYLGVKLLPPQTLREEARVGK